MSVHFSQFLWGYLTKPLTVWRWLYKRHTNTHLSVCVCVTLGWQKVMADQSRCCSSQRITVLQEVSRSFGLFESTSRFSVLQEVIGSYGQCGSIRQTVITVLVCLKLSVMVRVAVMFTDRLNAVMSSRCRRVCLQVKYKRDFEESKGRGFSIVTDTPELQRLRKTQEHISNVWYTDHYTVVKTSACVCVCVR